MSNYILQLAGSAAPVAVYTKKGDRNYPIGFEIYDGKDPYDLTGCTVLINLTKPDEHTYIGIANIKNEAAGSVDVFLDNERQMTAAEGEGTLELVIIRGGLRRGTANARWIVQEALGSELVSGTVIDGIDTIIENAVSAANTAEQAAQDVAQAISAAEESAEAAAQSASEARSIALGNILDIIYPVGSIVQYTDASIDPNTLLGGTWRRIQGRFLFAADSNHSVGTNGGSETVTLTASNIPAHRHLVMSASTANAVPNGSNTLARYDRSFGSRTGEYYNLNANSDEAIWGRSSATGGGTAHNNMPPYTAICIWKRTA